MHNMSVVMPVKAHICLPAASQQQHACVAHDEMLNCFCYVRLQVCNSCSNTTVAHKQLIMLSTQMLSSLCCLAI